MLWGAPGTLSLPWMRRGREQGTGVGTSPGTSKLVSPLETWTFGLGVG